MQTISGNRHERNISQFIFMRSYNTDNQIF